MAWKLDDLTKQISENRKRQEQQEQAVECNGSGGSGPGDYIGSLTMFNCLAVALLSFPFDDRTLLQLHAAKPHRCTNKDFKNL